MMRPSVSTYTATHADDVIVPTVSVVVETESNQLGSWCSVNSSVQLFVITYRKIIPRDLRLANFVSKRNVKFLLLNFLSLINMFPPC